MTKTILVLAAIVLAAGAAQAQVGSLIWEEDFDDLDNWIKLTGNGSWGWGNGELEFYKEENVGRRADSRRAGQQRPAHHRQAGERSRHRRPVGQPAELHLGQGHEQVARCRSSTA